MIAVLQARAVSRAWRLAVAVFVASVAALLALSSSAGAAASSGALYAFGINGYGELGIKTHFGSTTPNWTPAAVALPGGRGSVKQVAVGQAYSLVLTTDGQLYAFGLNYYGQLAYARGEGTNNSSWRPALVRLPGRVGAITAIAAGQGHSVALTSSGQLYAWGKNDDGELGISLNNGNFNADPRPSLVRLPGRVGPVKQISAGNDFTLALTASGQLYAFGQNQNGELGDTQNNGHGVANPTPRLVLLPGQAGRITHISAGGVHALVATASGQLYAFGENIYGELGTATGIGQGGAHPVPTLVALPGRRGAVTQISAGDEDSLAATASGQLYAFGDNQYGRLGNAVNDTNGNPNPVPKLVTLRRRVGAITQVSAELTYSLALTANGQLYTFGDNQYGQLGRAANARTHNANPTPTVVAFPRGTKVTEISEGSEGSQTFAFSAKLPARSSGQRH